MAIILVPLKTLIKKLLVQIIIFEFCDNNQYPLVTLQYKHDVIRKAIIIKAS